MIDGIFSFTIAELFIVLITGVIAGFLLLPLFFKNPALYAFMVGVLFFGGRTVVLFVSNNELWHRTLGALLLWSTFTLLMLGADALTKRRYAKYLD